MYQTYNKHRKSKKKAGVNRITHVRDFFTEKIGEDLTPMIVNPYAATKITRNVWRYATRNRYTKDIILFYTNLIMFKNVLVQANPNPTIREEKRINLLKTIPVGRTVGAFLNRPYIAYSINLLKTKLQNNFTFPQRGSVAYIELLGLIDEIRVIMKKGLDEKQLPYPLPLQRTQRIVSSPREILDELALGRRYKSRRNRH